MVECGNYKPGNSLSSHGYHRVHLSKQEDNQILPRSTFEPCETALWGYQQAMVLVDVRFKQVFGGGAI